MNERSKTSWEAELNRRLELQQYQLQTCPVVTILEGRLMCDISMALASTYIKMVHPLVSSFCEKSEFSEGTRYNTGRFGFGLIKFGHNFLCVVPIFQVAIFAAMRTSSPPQPSCLSFSIMPTKLDTSYIDFKNWGIVTPVPKTVSDFDLGRKSKVRFLRCVGFDKNVWVSPWM
jgi:hypothetical protein